MSLHFTLGACGRVVTRWARLAYRRVLRVSGRHWAEGDTQATWGGLPLSAPLWDPTVRSHPSLPASPGYHEGDPASPQRVCQQLGELAVPEGDVALLPLWVQQQGDAVTWVGTRTARLQLLLKATQLVQAELRPPARPV